MIDFSRPASVRSKLWTTEPPKEEDDLATSAKILPDAPTGQQLSNATALRDNTLAALAQHLTSTLVWMNSGEVERGSYWETARTRDTSAKNLLVALREDEVIGALLDDHAYVNPLLWHRLENLLVDAFHQISTSPAALEDLLQSELRAIAQRAARFDVTIEPGATANSRERALAERIVSFVPDTEIVQTPTTLSQRIVELFGQADDAMSRTNTFTRLLITGLAPLVEDAKRFGDATAAHGPNAMAWMFHAIVGIGNLEGDKQDELWRAINGLATDKIDISKSRLFDRKVGVLAQSRRHLDSAAAWEGLKSMVALLVLREAVLENDKAPAMKTIGVMKSVLEVATGSAEFVGTLAKSPTFMKAMAQHGEGLFEKMARVGDNPALKGAGLFTAWLGFVTTVMSAKQTTTMTATEREIEGEKVLFSGMQLALAGLSVVTGGLPLAALAMFVGQTLLTSRATWMALLFPRMVLPGTGRFVRGVWASISQDKELGGVTKNSPWRGEIETHLGVVEDYTSEAHDPGRGAFWPLTKGELIIPEIVRGILARQYGLDEGSTAKLASP